MSSETYTALVLPAKGSALELKTRPLPSKADPGTAIVQILATNVSPNTVRLFAKESPIPMALPMVPSSTAIARVHVAGLDATRLQKGQLVFLDFMLRSRDDVDDSILLGYIGGFDPASMKLMEGEWRDGSYAQYAKIPLESLFPLNEELLCGQLGYSFADLAWLGPCFVSAGGWYEIGVKAGDTVIVAPGTGYFGGAAVQVALGMGARVIAAGRNEDTMRRMTEVFGGTGRFKTVKLTGDGSKDTESLKAAVGNRYPDNKGVDAYMDFSPPAAAQNHGHISACINALRPFGKVAIMGGIFGNVEIPYYTVMRNSIRLQGRYMYTKDQAMQVVRLVEMGSMKLGDGEGSGVKIQGSFKLDKGNEAVEMAAKSEYSGWGNMIVLEP